MVLLVIKSQIQEAEDKDPSISKLPAHKVDKDQLRKDTSLGRDATFDEKELVAANDRKIWEKDAADYDKNMGSVPIHINHPLQLMLQN